MSKTYGVLLTEEGWGELSDALAPYVSKGPIRKYIYSRRAYSEGAFFVIEASCKNRDGSTFDAELSVPLRFVKLVVSSADEEQIGFMQSSGS